MPFPIESLGLQLEPQSWSASPRRILAYAAGIGASEPAYLDDAQVGGLRALPFQCVSLEWPVLLSMRHATRDVLTPQEASRGVHAVQDSTFHRPVRPGDRLVTEGQLVSAKPIRAGVLTVCRLITRDSDSGEPVTTTWTSSIYRNVGLTGEATPLAEPAPLDPVDAAPPGPNARETRIHIPTQMPHVYSECANIWNPIHTERHVALAAGLPDIILHGTATWALAGLTILREHGRDDVGALKRLTGRFSGMVMPGDDIVVRHEPAPTGAIRFDVRTSSGAPAITQGVAWLDV
jgi:acyl dehydratase